MVAGINLLALPDRAYGTRMAGVWLAYGRRMYGLSARED